MELGNLAGIYVYYCGGAAISRSGISIEYLLIGASSKKAKLRLLGSTDAVLGVRFLVGITTSSNSVGGVGRSRIKA